MRLAMLADVDLDAPEQQSEQQTVASLTTQLHDALAERNECWGEAQRARALDLEVRHTRKIIADMKRSPSWRLTTPLREGKQGLRWAKRTAGRLRKELRGS